MSSQDRVEHPEHYTRGGIECWDAIAAALGPDGFEDYCRGNVIKYLWRWRDKGGVEDLRKARQYLDRMISDAQRTHNGTDENQWEKPAFVGIDLALEPDHTANVGRNKGCMVFGEGKEPAERPKTMDRVMLEACASDYGRLEEEAKRLRAENAWLRERLMNAECRVKANVSLHDSNALSPCFMLCTHKRDEADYCDAVKATTMQYPVCVEDYGDRCDEPSCPKPPYEYNDRREP